MSSTVCYDDFGNPYLAKKENNTSTVLLLSVLGISITSDHFDKASMIISHIFLLKVLQSQYGLFPMLDLVLPMDGVAL